MVAVKREDIMEKKVSDHYACTCGLPAPLSYKNIKTKYDNSLITVRNVPVYECSNHHVKLSRLTRVKLTQKLKEAYLSNNNEISF